MLGRRYLLRIMVKVKIAVIGGISQELKDKKLLKWKSDVFSICGDIVKCNLNAQPDLEYNRGFSDETLKQCLPTLEQIRTNSNNKDNWDITIYVMSVPLQGNYYSRILNENRIVVTYYDIKNLLNEKDIPLENYLLRLLYAYTLVFMAKEGKVMSMQDEGFLSHEDSRGCIFDMSGTYQDISYSSVSPTICEECVGKLVTRNIPNNKIQQIRKELKGVRLTWNNRLNLFLKRHPILSIVLTIFSTLLLGLIVNYIWSLIK